MSREREPVQHKYVRIANDLRALIEREYAPGQRLPGENELAERFGVATLTVRQAIARLRGEGLVESRKGSGVYVQAFRPIRRRGVPRLARQQWGEGKSIWDADEDRPLDVDQISVIEATPSEEIRKVLGLATGETVCVRSRRYSVEGRPVMLAASYLPQALVAGSAIAQPDTGPGGIYARLADLGHAPVRFREEVRARMPSAGEAARLSIPADRFVLKVIRTAFAADGPVEVNEMTMDSAAYVLEYSFNA
ncbi:GntR family transcriptional regulator [Streptomyces megasporus]|uniref:GntR family transcriptional regulator n=1 Tax=Streptomyces megasporus TaxID=44060 RepID=UPI0004E19C5B|nr:GntR family transcriptional regulator [Streptomyces megasporus]